MAALSSIDLNFDKTTESVVRGEWDALERAGFSSLGAHTAASNRPHITLAAGSSIEPIDEADVTSAIGGGPSLPLPLTIGAPVLFGTGDRRVLARLVTPTAALLDLQSAVHASLRQETLVGYTRPGGWVAHVTLARRIRLADLPTALELLGDDIVGEATEMRLWNAEAGVSTLL